MQQRKLDSQSSFGFIIQGFSSSHYHSSPFPRKKVEKKWHLSTSLIFGFFFQGEIFFWFSGERRGVGGGWCEMSGKVEKKKKTRFQGRQGRRNPKIDSNFQLWILLGEGKGGVGWLSDLVENPNDPLDWFAVPASISIGPWPWTTA